MKKIALLALLALFGFYTYSQATPACSTGMSHILSSVSGLFSLSAVSQTIPADSSSLDYIATEVIQQNVAERSMNWNELVPILALTVPFIMVIVIVFISMSFSTKEKIARYKILEKAIDKGVAIPNSLFEEPNKRKFEKTYFFKAIQNILLGFVLCFALSYVSGFRVGVWMLIMVAIGVSQLINYYVEVRKNDATGSITGTQPSPRQHTPSRSEEPEITECEEVNAKGEHIDGQIK